MTAEQRRNSSDRGCYRGINRYIRVVLVCTPGGVRFVLWCGICQAQNYLLGVEFLIVGISATNFTTFIATGWQTNYDVAIFLDAFSRGVGVPIVGTLGLMAVTHGYKPSPAKDFILFLAAFSVTAIYFLSTAFKPWLPYFYVLMWALYTLYLLYFIWCLARAGEFLHALATLLGAQGDDCAEV